MIVCRRAWPIVTAVQSVRSRSSMLAKWHGGNPREATRSRGCAAPACSPIDVRRLPSAGWFVEWIAETAYSVLALVRDHRSGAIVTSCLISRSRYCPAPDNFLLRISGEGRATPHDQPVSELGSSPMSWILALIPARPTPATPDHSLPAPLDWGQVVRETPSRETSSDRRFRSWSRRYSSSTARNAC